MPVKQTPTLLTIGTTGVVIHPHLGAGGVRFQKKDIEKCLVRVNFREALAAGTHTAWYKEAGSSVAIPAPVWAPDTEVNPTTSVAVRGVQYGPFLDGDTFGVSSTGTQTDKAVYYDIIPL